MRHFKLIGYYVCFGHPILLRILLSKQKHIVFGYNHFFKCNFFVWILWLGSTKSFQIWGRFYEPPSIVKLFLQLRVPFQSRFFIPNVMALFRRGPLLTKLSNACEEWKNGPLNDVISNNIEWLCEICSDTMHRAAFLRQLSFLFVFIVFVVSFPQTVMSV